MVFSPEMLLPMGPPPQAVLDQRWLWNTLICLLGITSCLRVLGLDIAGALLSGLMLGFAVIMTREGMQEMGKYALVYAVLCGLNFLFDILPLLTEIGGRVSRTTEPVNASRTPDGARQITYTMTTKFTPFFDAKEGFIYNVQSATMILSPICMALGVYLAMGAHNEISRVTSNFWDADIEDYIAAPPTAAAESGLEAAAGARSRGAGPLQSGRTGMFGDHQGGARETFERFSGQGHKLSA